MRSHAADPNLNQFDPFIINHDATYPLHIHRTIPQSLHKELFFFTTLDRTLQRQQNRSLRTITAAAKNGAKRMKETLQNQLHVSFFPIHIHQTQRSGEHWPLTREGAVEKRRRRIKNIAFSPAYVHNIKIEQAGERERPISCSADTQLNPPSNVSFQLRT